ncbi:MAG: hypothetical protein HKM04_02290 [Legionellales bacterium]|nr:hypothetical protein [Legionellales bacterium]
MENDFSATEHLVTDNWSNDLNQRQFYEYNLCESILRGYAALGGLDTGCDINLIFADIKNSKNLLEIGAGYGRVIRKLLDLEFMGEIHALEKSHTFYNNLQEKFASQVTTHHADILHFDTQLKFSTIISMWSGISDFTKVEQQLFFNKLASLLMEDGQIFMDTSLWNQKPLNATELANQSYIITAQDSILHGYIPTSQEIEEYAAKAGLKLIRHFTYETDAKRKRLMYVFSL